MRAVAIKKGSREKTIGFQEMGVLRCDGCGEEFFIGHDPHAVDRSVAERQAMWLEKVLAEEHDVPAVVSEMNGTMERAIKELLSPIPADVATSPAAAKKN
jgi:hypothetical protein